MSDRAVTASCGVVAGVERVEMFGGHVGERAAEHFARRSSRCDCCEEMLKSASIGRP